MDCKIKILVSAIFLLSACSIFPFRDRYLENIPPGMVYIPAGYFLMGSSPAEAKAGIDVGVDEFPQHRVYLKGFYLDKYEVTNRDYAEFLQDNGKKHMLPEYYQLDRDPLYPSGQDDYPVVDVNWYAASDYCRWKGKRLPTEEEWEKAARGEEGQIYPWGNNPEKGKANTEETGLLKLASVGSFPEDRSPYGVYDLTGNVSEWTSSLYKFYPGNRLKRKEAGDDYAVVRGGAFLHPLKLGRAANRRYDPKTRYIPGLTWSGNMDLGFRCARDLTVGS